MFSKVAEYFSPSVEITQKRLTSAAIIMCMVAVFFYSYEYYLRVAPSVMAQELKQAFGLGEAAFGFLAAFYYYAYVLMQIPVGVTLDRFGPRRVLTFACITCVVGTYIFSSTASSFNPQIGRLLIGFGSAFAYVGVLKIANVWLPKHYFGLVAGICTTLGMLGAISGEVLMTALVQAVGWQSTMFYAGSVGVILVGMLWLVLRDEPRGSQGKPLDIVELETQELERFREIVLSREIWKNGLIGCFTFLPITAFAEIWAISFLEAAGMSRTEAAIGSSMLFVGFAIGAPMWGILSNRLKSRRIPMMIGSFVAAIFMGILILYPSSSVPWMYSLLLLSAIFASVEVLVFAVSDDLSHDSVTATATAFTNMVVMMGGALLPPIIGKLLEQEMGISLHSFSQALLLLPIGLLLAAVLSFSLKESYRKD